MKCIAQRKTSTAESDFSKHNKAISSIHLSAWDIMPRNDWIYSCTERAFSSIFHKYKCRWGNTWWTHWANKMEGSLAQVKESAVQASIEDVVMFYSNGLHCYNGTGCPERPCISTRVHVRNVRSNDSTGAAGFHRGSPPGRMEVEVVKIFAK